MVITAEHIATTIERIGTLCNELRDTNSSALPFVDRLHGVMLASELYDIAGQLDAQREETLSSYFGENSLRQNLQNIVLIEDMQRELSDVCFLVNAENADAYAQKIKDAYSSKQLLSKLPVVEIWHNMAYDAYKNKIKAKKGAKELLKHLKENNIKIAIVTSNSHELIEAGLKNNDLYDYIDLVITADSLSTNKDTPYIFEETARRLDVEPENIIAFDDLCPVIKAINEANIRSVAVYDKRSIKAYGEELMKDTADYYIKDFTEVLA